MSEEITIPDPMRLEVAQAFQGPAAQIDQLFEVNSKMRFDYDTPAGNKLARSHVHKLRGINGDIERARVATKEVALRFGRAVDQRAKDLRAEVDAMIAIHQEPLDAIERREKERQAKIQAVIDSLYRDCQPSIAAYQGEIGRVLEIEVTAPICMERAAEAGAKKDERLAYLRDAVERMRKEEAEHIEAERLRKEAAERERAERDRRIAEEAAARGTAAAEAAAAAKIRAAEEAQRKAEADAKRAIADAEAAKEAAPVQPAAPAVTAPAAVDGRNGLRHVQITQTVAVWRDIASWLDQAAGMPRRTAEVHQIRTVVREILRITQ